MRNINIHSYHQSLSPYFNYPGQSSQLFGKVFSDLQGVLYQIFTLHHIQHGNGGTRQVISPESGSQYSFPCLYPFVNKYSRHRESVPHAFSHSNHVGFYPGIAMCKKLSAPPVPGLYFVKYQQSPAVVTTFSCQL